MRFPFLISIRTIRRIKHVTSRVTVQLHQERSPLKKSLIIMARIIMGFIMASNRSFTQPPTCQDPESPFHLNKIGR